MNIRFAEESDIETLSIYDKHIRVTELKSAVSLGRVIVAEDNGTFIGCLRWNLFWDNTPFMNLLFLPEEYRSSGYGKAIVSYWERVMQEEVGVLCSVVMCTDHSLASLCNKTKIYLVMKLITMDKIQTQKCCC